MQWRRHSDFRTSVESIGPAPAQFSYCLMSDKVTEQIASKNWLFCFFFARSFFRKFETDFSVFHFQICGERSSTFRDEPLQEIGFLGGKKFLRLFFEDLAAEDRFAHVSAQSAAPNEAEIQISLCLFSGRERGTRRSYCRASKRNFRSKVTFLRTAIPSLRPP